MKRILLIGFCFLLLILSLVGCKKEENKKNETDKEQKIENEIKEEKIEQINADGKTTLNSLSIKLISLDTNKFENMKFHEYIKSTITPSEDGTAMTMLIHTNDKKIPVSQIESITVKSAEGAAVNMNTKTYVLNSKEGCLVFAKTEGLHNPKEYAIQVKTYDGEERLYPIPETADENIIKNFTTNIGDAKFGDIVNIKENHYFILQSGSLSSTTYESEDKQYSEVIIGTALIPLKNTYEFQLENYDFETVFFDNDKLGDGGTKTLLLVNDENMIETYKDNFKGVFIEFLTYKFTLEITKNESQEQTIARRDYVMNNTWLKGTFEENFLYKPYNS